MDIRLQTEDDERIVGSLMMLAFGHLGRDRAVWNLRPGPAISSLSLVVSDGKQIVGSLRFWEISVAGKPQLLLGPLAIRPEVQGRGFGRALVNYGLEQAAQLEKWDYVFVSGDAHYYPKFGFQSVDEELVIWPGQLDPNRLQIRPLTKDGLDQLPNHRVALMPVDKFSH